MGQSSQGAGQRAIHPKADFRSHAEHQAGDLAAGATVAQAATGTALVPIFGSSKARVRFECNRAGTLVFEYTRPPSSLTPGQTLADLAVYGTKPAADVAVTIDTEHEVDINEIRGESYLKISYTEGNLGAAIITFLDVSQI